MKTLHSTIKFKHEGKPMQFDVISNIHEYGQSIENAFINWAARIDGPVILEDFCNYVESKDPNFACSPFNPPTQ